jgi:hypothetical protein
VTVPRHRVPSHRVPDLRPPNDRAPSRRTSSRPPAAVGLLAVLALLAAVAGWHPAGSGASSRAGLPAAPRAAAPAGGVTGSPTAGVRPAGHTTAAEHLWGAAVPAGARHVGHDLAPPPAPVVLALLRGARGHRAGAERGPVRDALTRRGRGPPGRRRSRRRPRPEAAPASSSERSSPCPLPSPCPAV